MKSEATGLSPGFNGLAPALGWQDGLGVAPKASRKGRGKKGKGKGKLGGKGKARGKGGCDSAADPEAIAPSSQEAAEKKRSVPTSDEKLSPPNKMAGRVTDALEPLAAADLQDGKRLLEPALHHARHGESPFEPPQPETKNTRRILSYDDSEDAQPRDILPEVPILPGGDPSAAEAIPSAAEAIIAAEPPAGAEHSEHGGTGGTTNDDSGSIDSKGGSASINIEPPVNAVIPGGSEQAGVARGPTKAPYKVDPEVVKMVVDASVPKDISVKERNKLYAAMGRSTKSDAIPPAALARYTTDRADPCLMFRMLQEWVQDPSWGSVTITEEHRRTLASKNLDSNSWVSCCLGVGRGLLRSGGFPILHPSNGSNLGPGGGVDVGRHSCYLASLLFLIIPSV